MRKILAYLFCLLFFASQSMAFGPGLIGKTQGMRLVTSGTSTAANTQISLVDGTAFAYLVGVDLSAYQTGKHLLAVYNSSTGLLIGQGYCSATPPAGETLDVELLTDPDMETDPTTNWNPLGVSLAEELVIVHGGSKSLKFTYLEGTTCRIYQQQALSTGALYVISGWEYSPTGNTLTPGLRIGTTISGSEVQYQTFATTKDAWVTASFNFTAPQATLYFNVSGITTGQSMYSDDNSLKQKTDPPSTGLQIVSTKGGAVQSWTYKGSGEVNAAITYKIWAVN